MKTRLFAVLFAVLPLAASAAEKALAAPETSKSAEPVKRHPLRGVITGIMADRSALLVKHEEIPGVMRAMTMMFKVDPATLKAAKEGQALTGLMSRQGNEWVLEEVKLLPEKKS